MALRCRRPAHALSGSYDNTLIWWDVTSDQVGRTRTGHSDSVRSVALSADGRHALSGSRDYTLIWWGL